MGFIYLLSIIGAILFVFERRNYKKRVGFIKEYIQSIKSSTLEDREKKERIINFFQTNGFEFYEDNRELLFKKKEFFLGLLLFGGGIFLVGALIYLLYHKYIQKEDLFRVSV